MSTAELQRRLKEKACVSGRGVCECMGGVGVGGVWECMGGM